MCDRTQAYEILSQVYQRCNTALSERIRAAYLYGSYARGDYDEESDVDILLTVDATAEEIARHRGEIAAVSSRLSLEHDVTVSVTAKPAEQFEKYLSVLPYYQNVVKEGVRYAG